MATVLKPGFVWMTQRKLPVHLAAMSAVLLSVLGVILPVGLLGLSVFRSLNRVVRSALQGAGWTERLQGLEQRIFSWPGVDQLFESEGDLATFLSEHIQQFVTFVGQALSQMFSSIPGLLLQTVLALLTAYYILVEGSRFREFMAKRVPLSHTVQRKLVHGLTDTAYSGFLSMLAAAAAQAVVVFGGFLVFGIPMSGLALGLAFVAAWIPIVGVTPVWLIGVGFLLVESRYGAAIGMVGFGVIAGFIDNLVRPWVLKGRADLHPLLGLISIFGGVYYFGIMGVLVGPVAVACGIEFLRIWPEIAKDLGLAEQK